MDVTDFLQDFPILQKQNLTLILLARAYTLKW